MSSLTGNLISDSYLGLLKTADNAVITSVTKSITDGAGNASALWLSNNLAKVSGSVQVTGSSIVLSDGIVAGHTTITTANITVENYESTVGAYMDLHGLEMYSGSNFLDITVAAEQFGSNGSGSLIAVANTSSQAVPVVAFQNHDNYVDGTVSILTPFQAKANAQVTGSLNISGSLKFATSSSFVLPVVRPAAPVAGTAYFSGSFLYIYNGSAFVSASFS